MVGQEVPSGYYVSNSSDADVFYADKSGNFYFKKEIGDKWSRTDKWNFDHICDVETVNEEQGVAASVDSHDGRGMEIRVSAHIGVTVSDVMKWHYINPDGNQATVWAGPEGGPGEGASVDAGVWYDKDGNIHVKFSTCGVIPHVAFGTDLVINPKTVEDLGKPTADDKVFAKGLTQGLTLGISDKAPPVITHTVAALHKLADGLGKLV
ncbi:hypothetical protein CMI37_12480 [Candidatus Pacearchaeota archaeon]|nr:hypothetical protein [Candidatus Pacearchaeota archaeon]